MSKTPGIGYGGNSGASNSIRRKASKPIGSITKSLSYSDTTNDLLLDISKTASASAQKSGDVSMVRVSNTGSFPAIAIF